MFEIIILVIVLLVIIGALKAMGEKDRKIVVTGAINATKVATAYTVTGTKELGKTAYRSGEYLGNEMSLNQQDALNATHEWNSKLKTRGAIVTGAKAARDHLDTIGVMDANAALAKAIKNQNIDLEVARAGRE